MTACCWGRPAHTTHPCVMKVYSKHSLVQHTHVRSMPYVCRYVCIVPCTRQTSKRSKRRNIPSCSRKRSSFLKLPMTELLISTTGHFINQLPTRDHPQRHTHHLVQHTYIRTYTNSPNAVHNSNEQSLVAQHATKLLDVHSEVVNEDLNAMAIAKELLCV